MSAPHTLRNYRQHWYPEIISRDTYDTWQEKGETIQDICQRKASEILTNHRAAVLPAETEAELERIMRGYVHDFHFD
jgi:trimethylamine:corrinoid methyltransferase-like protein